VISPIAPILRRDGVDLALVSVELWPQETIVRLAALVEDPVAKEDAFSAALDAWAADGREGPLPSEPGESVYKDVSISLTEIASSACTPPCRVFRRVFGTGVTVRNTVEYLPPRHAKLEHCRRSPRRGDTCREAAASRPGHHWSHRPSRPRDPEAAVSRGRTEPAPG
jgi:hypothetical protein